MEEEMAVEPYDGYGVRVLFSRRMQGTLPSASGLRVVSRDFSSLMNLLGKVFSEKGRNFSLDVSSSRPDFSPDELSKFTVFIREQVLLLSTLSEQPEEKERRLALLKMLLSDWKIQRFIISELLDFFNAKMKKDPKNRDTGKEAERKGLADFLNEEISLLASGDFSALSSNSDRLHVFEQICRSCDLPLTGELVFQKLKAFRKLKALLARLGVVEENDKPIDISDISLALSSPYVQDSLSIGSFQQEIEAALNVLNIRGGITFREYLPSSLLSRNATILVSILQAMSSWLGRLDFSSEYAFVTHMFHPEVLAFLETLDCKTLKEVNLEKLPPNIRMSFQRIASCPRYATAQAYIWESILTQVRKNLSPEERIIIASRLQLWVNCFARKQIDIDSSVLTTIIAKPLLAVCSPTTNDDVRLTTYRADPLDEYGNNTAYTTDFRRMRHVGLNPQDEICIPAVAIPGFEEVTREKADAFLNRLTDNNPMQKRFLSYILQQWFTGELFGNFRISLFGFRYFPTCPPSVVFKVSSQPERKITCTFDYASATTTLMSQIEGEELIGRIIRENPNFNLHFTLEIDFSDVDKPPVVDIKNIIFAVSPGQAMKFSSSAISVQENMRGRIDFLDSHLPAIADFLSIKGARDEKNAVIHSFFDPYCVMDLFKFYKKGNTSVPHARKDEVESIFQKGYLGDQTWGWVARQIMALSRESLNRKDISDEEKKCWLALQAVADGLEEKLYGRLTPARIEEEKQRLKESIRVREREVQLSVLPSRERANEVHVTKEVVSSSGDEGDGKEELNGQDELKRQASPPVSPRAALRSSGDESVLAGPVSLVVSDLNHLTEVTPFEVRGSQYYLLFLDTYTREALKQIQESNTEQSVRIAVAEHRVRIAELKGELSAKSERVEKFNMEFDDKHREIEKLREDSDKKSDDALLKAKAKLERAQFEAARIQEERDVSLKLNLELQETKLPLQEYEQRLAQLQEKLARISFNRFCSDRSRVISMARYYLSLETSNFNDTASFRAAVDRLPLNNRTSSQKRFVDILNQYFSGQSNELQLHSAVMELYEATRMRGWIFNPRSWGSKFREVRDAWRLRSFAEEIRRNYSRFNSPDVFAYDQLALATQLANGALSNEATVSFKLAVQDNPGSSFANVAQALSRGRVPTSKLTTEEAKSLVFSSPQPILELIKEAAMTDTGKRDKDLYEGYMKDFASMYNAKGAEHEKQYDELMEKLATRIASRREKTNVVSVVDEQQRKQEKIVKGLVGLFSSSNNRHVDVDRKEDSRVPKTVKKKIDDVFTVYNKLVPRIKV